MARRGSARIVLPARSDNQATIGAARHLYARMLDAGVALHEFLPQKLHMKLLAIDDLVYLGSANFDKRSLFINLELMLRVEDAGLAAEVRSLVDQMAGQSEQIDIERYSSMGSPWQRLCWWVQFLLVGVLDYTVTRRLNFRRGQAS